VSPARCRSMCPAPKARYRAPTKRAGHEVKCGNSVCVRAEPGTRQYPDQGAVLKWNIGPPYIMRSIIIAVPSCDRTEPYK